MKPLPLLFASAGVDLLAAFAFSVDSNLASVVGVLVGTVVVVLAVINYIDSRIDMKLRTFEQITAIRHDGLIADIRALKQLLGKGEKP